MEKFNFEEIKNFIKKVGKRILKVIKSFVLPIVLIIAIITVLLAGFVYLITLDDGSKKEGDISNAPYAASTYTQSVTIDENGNITTNMTAQALWDEMIKNNSRVNVYLEGPEDLLKLMNAELVTNYPDTRPNPDEEIDWETLNKDVTSNKVQGIIKFRRARDDGSTITLTFVNADTFYDWVEEYNISGDESVREQILTHFTIVEGTGTGIGGSNVQLNYNGKDIITDISEAIVRAAQTTPSPGAGLCQAWVRQVYANAGLPNVYYTGAYQAFQQTCVSTDVNNIPIGAAVYGTGSANNPYGHVGIYVGDINGDGKGEVMDNVSNGIRTQSLEDWIAWQVNAGNTQCGGTPGWLGWGWQSGSPSQILSGGDSSTDNNSSATEDSNLNEIVNSGTNTEDGNTGTSTNGQVASLDNVLFIGDSITAGLDNSGLIPNAPFYAEASTTPRDWLGRVDSLPQNSDEISAVCVMLGVNATNQTSEMKQLIDALATRYNGKTIYVQKVLPVANTYTAMDYQTMNQNIAAYNTEISNYCSGKTNIKFIDTSSGYVDETGAAKADLFDSQGLHPKDYEQLKENIERAILGGLSQTYSASKYSVVVGTWSERYEERKALGETDPEEQYVEPYTTYTMTTQSIDYQRMVSGYTMPFDYLWAWLVTGRERDFVLDVADLVYDSEIEITIHDNYTKTTDVDTYNYTRKTKVHTHDISTTISYSNGEENAVARQATERWKEGDTEEILKQYSTQHTVITTSNTLDISLTKADVWIVEYTKEYTYEPEETNVADPITSDLETVEYPEEPDKTDNEDPCGIADGFAREKLQEYIANYGTAEIIRTLCTSDYYYGYEGTVTNNNTTVTRKYTSSPAEIIEKTDPLSEEPNFVTILQDHYQTRSNILSAPDWLYKILETSEKTVDMIDLTKYLMYKATGVDLGVTEYDFSVFDPKNFVNVSLNIAGGNVQEKVWNALRSAGFSEYATAGAMGNIQAESGFNPGVEEHANGVGFGLCQWSYGRRTQLENYAASKGVSASDVDTQIEFLISELTPGGAGPAQGYATYQLVSYNGYNGDMWKNATSPEEAATAFCWSFERPGTPNLTTRQDSARQYYNMYAGGGASSAN